MSNPERIYVSTVALPQALKDGTGTYYPNFTGDPAQFNLAVYVPESRIREEREVAQQLVFAEAIRQGVDAVRAATIAGAALERSATTEASAGKREREKEMAEPATHYLSET